MILDHENGYMGRGFIWTTTAVVTAVAAVTGPICFEAVEITAPWVQAVEASAPWVQEAEITAPWVQSVQTGCN